MSQFHRLTVKKINRLTDKAVSISFNVPESLKEIYSFKAGQYITLKTTIDGNEVRRDYSLCASRLSGELKVSVKEVVGGRFSSYANRTLKVGDPLEVAPPNGRFVFEPDTDKSRSIAAFAAGSGITPIMSIIKTILEEEIDSKIVLVYGNRSPEDTIFYDELIDLQSKYPERFFLQLVFSRSRENGSLFGRIERSTVNYIIKNKHKDISFNAYYLCGPEDMIDTVSEALLENRVKKEDIHFELFTVSAPKTGVDDALAAGTTQITVLVDDEETSFQMSRKQTILEAALAKDIDAPYSCQGGICSTCIARITEGEATMRQNNILTDGEVEEGLILTCQAQPTTPTIAVDYDDV
jgi:ring-1,2-phenylacetyl-CoA epoxidase subunit PaaE